MCRGHPKARNKILLWVEAQILVSSPPSSLGLCVGFNSVGFHDRAIYASWPNFVCSRKSEPRLFLARNDLPCGCLLYRDLLGTLGGRIKSERDDFVSCRGQQFVGNLAHVSYWSVACTVVPSGGDASDTFYFSTDSAFCAAYSRRWRRV